jgi:predicted heme/steroid binding protein
MVKAQFWLEWKKQPWLVHLFCAVLLIGLFSLLAYHQEVRPKYGVGYDATDTMRWSDGTTQGDHDFFVHDLQHEIADFKDEPQTSEKYWFTRAVRADHEVLAKLKRHDYLAVNRILYKFNHDNSLQTNRVGFGMLQQWYSHSLAHANSETVATLRYVIQRKMNMLVQIDQSSAVINNFAAVWGVNNQIQFYDDAFNMNSSKLLLLLMIMASVAFCLVFFRDRRQGTASFMQTAPLGNFRQALLRAIVTLIVLNGIIALICGAMLITLLLVPGHAFGTIDFPIVFTLLGKSQVWPLWLCLLAEWGLLNCWFCFIAGVAYLMSQVTRNEILGMAVLALILFAGQLHLDALVPAAVWHQTPSAMTSLDMIIHHESWLEAVPLARVFALLLGWTGVVWLLAFGCHELRAHRWTR